MPEHTPTPWVIDGPTGYANHPGCMIYAPDGNGHLVAMFPPEYADNQAENAAHVVRCVNERQSHIDALNDALCTLIAAGEVVDASQCPGISRNIERCQGVIRDALA